MLLIKYVLKITKLVLTILLIVYFVGLGWFVFCDFTSKFLGHDDSEFFLDYFEAFKTHTADEATLALSYYILTTLSTIGFGDMHPRSDYERILMAFTMLLGVAIFSYVMGNFIEILNQYADMNADLGEGEQLSKFFGLLIRFNRN